MQRLYEQTQSEFTRNRIRAFMTRVPCKVCGGARLKPEILAVTIKDRQGRELNIHQFSEQTTEAAAHYIDNLELTRRRRRRSSPMWCAKFNRDCNSWSRSASVI